MMTCMRFSFWPNAAQSWADTLATARHAEATGWDGIYVADHFLPSIGDDSGPTNECWGLLAGLAAAVPRVRLGSLVCGNTYRHPAVLANQAATVDQISGGRVVLGLGAGWQENEHEAYGIDLPAPGSRLDMLEEACQVVKGLLTQDRTTFDGQYYQLDNAPCEPKPVQDPLPLLIGGGGEKRTLRIAAQFADEWNVWGTPETTRPQGSRARAALRRRGPRCERDSPVYAGAAVHERQRGVPPAHPHRRRAAPDGASALRPR